MRTEAIAGTGGEVLPRLLDAAGSNALAGRQPQAAAEVALVSAVSSPAMAIGPRSTRGPASTGNDTSSASSAGTSVATGSPTLASA